MAGSFHLKTLKSIQALRAAAALSVVVFHAFQWLGDEFWIGAAGVDVFFVISGFIMWTVNAESPPPPAVFLWRRLTRVAPAYWLMTLAVAAIAFARPGFLPQVRLGLRHLLLSLAFVQHTDPNGLPFPLLPPGWTLDYEAIFYLVFAAALLLPASRRLWGVILGLTAVAAFGFLDYPAYTLGANPMMLQFAAGVWLGWRHVKGNALGPRWGAALLVGGVAALAAMQIGALRSDLFRPWLWGVPAAMIVAGAVAVEEAGVLRASGLAGRLVVRLGDASYAIYLCHLPATAVVAHAFGTQPAMVFAPLAIAASIAAGLAFHCLAERPLIRLARRFGPNMVYNSSHSGGHPGGKTGE